MYLTVPCVLPYCSFPVPHVFSTERYWWAWRCLICRRSCFFAELRQIYGQHPWMDVTMNLRPVFSREIIPKLFIQCGLFRRSTMICWHLNSLQEHDIFTVEVQVRSYPRLRTRNIQKTNLSRSNMIEPGGNNTTWAATLKPKSVQKISARRNDSESRSF